MRARPLLLAALTAAALAASAARAEEPAPPSYREVRVEGCEAFTAKTLVTTLGLPRKPALRPFYTLPPVPRADVPDRVEDLARFYYREGYFEATVDLLEPEEGVAVLRVREGQPSLVRGVRLVAGGEAVPPELEEARVRPQLPLRDGAPFRADDYDAAARQLALLWKERGFPFVLVAPAASVDLAARRVDVTLAVTPGERLSFGATTFEGVVHAEEAVLRRALAWREGKLYQQSQVDATLERLVALGLFDAVSVTPKQAGPGVVEMEVQVVEGRHRLVRAGLGYSSEDGPGVQVGWETLRFAGRTMTLGATATSSQRKDELAVYFRRPYIWDSKSRFLVDAKGGRQRETSFDYEYLDAQAGVDQSFGRGFRAGLFGRLEQVLQITPDRDLEDALEAGVTEVDTIASAVLGIHYDRSDNLLNPTRGYRASLSVEPSMVLDTKATFTRYLLEGRYYLPAGHGSVAAFRLRVGTLAGERPESVPLTRRFYAGGPFSVRGYRQGGLGPLSDTGALLGGNALVEASAELRFDLPKSLVGVVFADAGNAFETYREVLHGPFYAGAGVGVRYETPAGPIGLDLAFKLREDPLDPSGAIVHFYVGYAF